MAIKKLPLKSLKSAAQTSPFYNGAVLSLDIKKAFATPSKVNPSQGFTVVPFEGSDENGLWLSMLKRSVSRPRRSVLESDEEALAPNKVFATASYQNCEEELKEFLTAFDLLDAVKATISVVRITEQSNNAEYITFSVIDKVKSDASADASTDAPADASADA